MSVLNLGGFGFFGGFVFPAFLLFVYRHWYHSSKHVNAAINMSNAYYSEIDITSILISFQLYFTLVVYIVFLKYYGLKWYSFFLNLFCPAVYCDVILNTVMFTYSIAESCFSLPAYVYNGLRGYIKCIII